jgi:hypothetical protein
VHNRRLLYSHVNRIIYFFRQCSVSTVYLPCIYRVSTVYLPCIYRVSPLSLFVALCVFPNRGCHSESSCFMSLHEHRQRLTLWHTVDASYEGVSNPKKRLALLVVVCATSSAVVSRSVANCSTINGKAEGTLGIIFGGESL